jgi:hypothetical protein
MTICSKTLDAVRKRLEERKSLEEIGKELCDAVDDPRGKALRMVKQIMGKDNAEKYLIDNAEWLGYRTDKLAGGIAHAQKNLCIDSNRSKQNVSDILPSVVPKVIVNKIVTDSPKANTVSKTNVQTNIEVVTPKVDVPIIPIDIQPKINIDNSAGWKNENIQKIIIHTVSPIVETLPTTNIEKFSDIVVTKKSCIIGKNKLDCNICKFGIENKDGWICNNDYFDCMSKICFFDEEIVCECGFKTRHKDIFFGHVSVIHKDSQDLIKMVAGKILWDDIKREFIICPCGCGYGYRNSSENKNNRWYTKDELDELKKNAEQFIQYVKNNSLEAN